MIKLIASDLDGTLIDANNHCDSSVSTTLKALREKGLKFAVCSGRPIPSVLPLLKGWGLDEVSDYVIGSNGGEVLEVATGKQQTVYELSAETLRDIIDLYSPLGIIPTLYDGMTLYVERITEDVERVAERVGVSPVVGDIRSLTVKPELKEMFVVSPDQMRLVEQFAQEHPDPRFVGFKTAIDLFELSHPLLAKDVGVKIVESMMHITPNEIMAFGDTTNDIQMLEYVRYGVAMDNGTDDAKHAAWAIAPSVDAQGFASFIKTHLNEKLEVLS
ncbi:MAG: Cof-type HAD-IIB family hydrolase [Solobacterium sp.]|nr:Cof-type HAD-IIB family hydrolase [Solobacterium sp.]